MNPKREFHRRAESYDTYNQIQREVAKALVRGIYGTPRRILDLGCGSGQVSREITWAYEQLTAVDFAPGMCALFPKLPNSHVLNLDFNDPETFVILERQRPFDLILAGSALQWAHDLSFVLEKLKGMGRQMALGIFTAGTFQTLHETAGIQSPIRTADEVVETLHKVFGDPKIELRHFRLGFSDRQTMFHYIKQSGVSGGERRLGYQETRALYRNYPLDYLEYEVIVCRWVKD